MEATIIGSGLAGATTALGDGDGDGAGGIVWGAGGGVTAISCLTAGIGAGGTGGGAAAISS